MLKCGFYEKEITPPLGCCIPGYYTPRLADGVKDKLYCKAMAVSNEKDTIIIMSVDAISVHPETAKNILNRASEYTGVATENMNISAIHTHTGTPRNNPPGSKIYGDPEYEAYFTRIAADCMTLAFQAMEEATVKFGKGHIEGIAFNRVYVMADGRIQTAPEIGDKNVVRPHGPIDPELTVLYVEDKEGNPKGAIVNYACHPDVVKGSKYSPDWPGILCENLKDEFGRDFVGMFVNGTSGNINHVDVMGSTEYPPSEHYIKMGNIVAEEAIKAIKSSEAIKGEEIGAKKEFLQIPSREWDMKRIEWAKNIVATIKPIEGLTLGLNSGNQEQEDLHEAKVLLGAYEKRVDSYERGVGAMRLGDVYFYTVPSEMFVQFGLYMKENSPSDKNIVVQLSHGSSGYIPLKDLICDTVYESRRNAFPLKAGSGELISETAVKLAKEL